MTLRPETAGGGHPCYCGETRSRAVLRGTGFTVVRCAACGACRTEPAPLEQDDLTMPAVEDHRRFAEKYRTILREVLDEVLRLRTSGRLLDVGCSVGHLMALAQESGFEAWGIDTNARAVDYACQRFGERVHLGRVETAPFPPASFAAITANAVLEHVVHPVEFLAALRRLLAPGGILVVGVPNFDGWASRLEGARWYGLQPAGHVWQYTPSSLVAVLGRAGFRTLRVRTNQLHRKHGRTFRSRVKRLAYDAFERLRRGDGLLVTATPAANGAMR
jgi:SAM-dependent methyltransferase